MSVGLAEPARRESGRGPEVHSWTGFLNPNGGMLGSTFATPTREFCQAKLSRVRPPTCDDAGNCYQPSFLRKALIHMTSPDNVGITPPSEVGLHSGAVPAIPPRASGPVPLAPHAQDLSRYSDSGRDVTTVRRLAMTGAEKVWYVLQCIAFGAGYFAKIPTKKALSELGLVKLTGAERFWYILQCICFGAGYFTKVPVKKALSETGLVRLRSAEQFWYVLQCIAFGAGYFVKVPMRKALDDAGLAPMTAAGQFWYVLQCIGFGAGYFAKVPHKKALSEVAALPLATAAY